MVYVRKQGKPSTDTLTTDEKADPYYEYRSFFAEWNVQELSDEEWQALNGSQFNLVAYDRDCWQ
jgi:hypothetical protein